MLVAFLVELPLRGVPARKRLLHLGQCLRFVGERVIRRACFIQNVEPFNIYVFYIGADFVRRRYELLDAYLFGSREQLVVSRARRGYLFERFGNAFARFRLVGHIFVLRLRRHYLALAFERNFLDGHERFGKLYQFLDVRRVAQHFDFGCHSVEFRLCGFYALVFFDLVVEILVSGLQFFYGVLRLERYFLERLKLLYARYKRFGGFSDFRLVRQAFEFGHFRIRRIESLIRIYHRSVRFEFLFERIEQFLRSYNIRTVANGQFFGQIVHGGYESLFRPLVALLLRLGVRFGFEYIVCSFVSVEFLFALRNFGIRFFRVVKRVVYQKRNVDVRARLDRDGRLYLVHHTYKGLRILSYRRVVGFYGRFRIAARKSETNNQQQCRKHGYDRFSSQLHHLLCR